MFLEVIGAYSLFRWLTSGSDGARRNWGDKIEDPYQLLSDQNFIIPIKIYDRCEVLIKVWATEPIDMLLLNHSDLDTWKNPLADKHALKKINHLGQVKTNDDGKFWEMSAVLEQGTYNLLLVNWSKDKTATVWRKVSFN